MKKKGGKRKGTLSKEEGRTERGRKNGFAKRDTPLVRKTGKNR